MPKEFVVLSRDSFARADFVRKKAEEGECDWCGRMTKLFQYGWHSDDKREPHFHDKSFCCVGCYRAYRCE